VNHVLSSHQRVSLVWSDYLEAKRYFPDSDNEDFKSEGIGKEISNE